ncbi:MaoC-like dehydratase [Sphingobium indicum BiD32]|uniref:MaoC-like dehydratase n=1 Tax=Sphingobium indicum BiD32 TaxID=1301087 RepID=N1MJI8_9SPHN|nr:MaoC family dehydratase [Sphingobium indicum]CCW17365.1 MaoC-like dehydratase [Sphingobium indicum BiD32]
MTYTEGQTLPSFVIDKINPEAMKQWAIFLADPNPIHLDVAAVRAKGLGDRVINQGPINVAYMMNALLQAFPGARIESMTSRFLDNVYGGEKIIASARIDAVGEGRISCSVTLESVDRGAVCSANAVILPKE